MKLLLKLLCAGLLFSSPLIAKKSSKNNEFMLADLDLIKQTFQVGYAPAEWKKQFSGWDLDAQIKMAKRQVARNGKIGLKQFQRILKNFFLSTQDYHATIKFYSTESAYLPFKIQEAEGKYFFTYINRKALPDDSDFPFNVGDELVLFDDLPLKTVLDELREKEVGNNNFLTDCAMAEIYLTTRSGRLGHEIPSGEINLSGYKAGSNSPITYQMEWTYTPEKVTAPPTMKSLSMKLIKGSQLKSQAKNSYFLKQFVMPQYEALAALRAEDDEPTDMYGSRKSLLPILGKVLWESDQEAIFHAYLFEMPAGKVGGYIRIPTFLPDDVDLAVAEFGKVIESMEQKADVLVVDQVNNPGGYLLYVYALASMLTDKPLTVPKHQLALAQEDVYFANKYIPILEDIETAEEAKEFLEEYLPWMPANLELAQVLLEHLRFVDAEWNSGRLLTIPCYLYGIGPLLPHPEVHFTKPILVLINQLDISGADFFPAILQDSGRATIFGTCTAGAGGFLGTVDFPNLHGISAFSFTASIAERPDEQFIENHGVTPDVPYRITQTDLQKNYVDYVAKIQQTLDLLINKHH